MLHQSEIDLIRKFYSNKKTKFANNQSYYHNKQLWGEIYGFELKDPYTENDVNAFEKMNGILLDNNLKMYLTKISREIFVSDYPCEFDFDVVYDDDGQYITIGEDGCSFGYVMYVTEKNKGKIYSYDDENKYFKYNTFKEFIMEEINKN